jgi:regulator of sigma D
MTKLHAKLSASGSAKWLNCPGSVNAESVYPKSSSSYADEGTLAHEIADLCLKNRKDAVFYLGKTLKELNIKISSIKQEHKIDDEMVQNVQEYVDYVLSFETTDSILFTEEKVDFSNVVPEGFGTCDSAILVPHKRRLHIFDLKYGKGVPVDAFENTQGQMYAIGFYNQIGFLDDFDDISIHICQPRINNFSEWEISVKDLIKFSKWVAERAELALTPNAPRVPGEKQCQWCLAKGDCKALLRFTEDIIGQQFDNLDEVENQSLTNDNKKTILDNKDLIIDFLSSVEKSVYEELLKGTEFKGYKLVEGRSNRAFAEKLTYECNIISYDEKYHYLTIKDDKFKDKELKFESANVLIELNEGIFTLTTSAEQLMLAVLEEEAYSKKLIGIGDAEKKLGKKVMEEITIKPAGKLTMVKESDNRKAVSVTKTEDLFDTLN